MFGRTMTAMALAATVLATGMIAGPGEAEARTRALLVARTGPAGDGDLAGLRTALRQDGEVADIQMATLPDPVAMAGAIRAFLSAPNQGDDLRLVWVAGGGYGSPGSVCPPWSEEAVRPAGPSIIVAPACFKVLVQPATPYERFDTANLDADDGALLYAITPGVAFFSTPDAPSGSVAAMTTALTDTPRAGAESSLVMALSCRQPATGPFLAADFSPGASAWGIHAADCRPTRNSMNVAAVAPPSSETPLATRNEAPASLPAAGVVPVAAPAVSAGPPPAEGKPDVPTDNGKVRFVSPVHGRVVAAFGSLPAPGGAANKGIDFEASPGAAVKAAEGGEVVFVGELPRYGTVVAIKHDNDWATVYGQAINVRVAKGARVGKGQPLAEVDPGTRRLHFEVRRKGKAVDPQSLIAPVG